MTVTNYFNRIQAKSLVPVQSSVVHGPNSTEPFTTTRGFKVKADFYAQKSLKHRKTSYFHSYAEYLYAALLEADPTVQSYVPQPFRLLVDRRRYVPDFYVRKNGVQLVIELKPRGEFDSHRLTILEEFFHFHDMQFKIIANEDAFKQEIMAKNWWTIIRTLLNHLALDTRQAEYLIYEKIALLGTVELKELIDWQDRPSTLYTEIALFRLAHRGKVKIICHQSILNERTKVSL